jgi:hypothetical protein
MRSTLGVLPLLVATRLAAQSPDTTSFITMQGTDTIAVEQYVRTGNAIAGVWLQNQGGVYWHDYALVLGTDGWPAQYVMTLYTSRPHTFLLSVTYGADSATRIMVRDAVAATERVATPKGFPVGALSILSLDLALPRARQEHRDSTTILLDRAEVRGPSPPIPVKFFAGDSVRIGPGTMARIDRDGRLLALQQGPRETRRVGSFDLARLGRGFIRADSIARASRVAVALPPAALDQFTGEYSLNPSATIVVSRVGDKLMMHVGLQPPTELLASSPTTFFMEASTAVTFEFETDASGAVTGLALVQNGSRQRAAKTK